MRRKQVISPHKDRNNTMERIPRIRRPGIVLLVLLVSFAGMALTQEKEHVANIIRINGTLEFRGDSGQEWEEVVKVPGALYDGNQLRTGTGDKAIIMYLSGTRVLINENTVIEIQGSAERGAEKKTNLILGEIYNRVRTGDKYQVETPSSVASVRGTEFNAQTDGNTDTYLGMSGLVEVMNDLGQVLLGQLQMTTVQKGQGPAEAEDVDPDVAKKMTEWIEGVEPTWKLNLVPEHGTDQQLEGVFTLSIWALRDGSLDADAAFPLTEFSADSDAIEFSTDEGATWLSDPPQITLINGQASLTCRIMEEATVSITAKAEDAQTAILDITASRPAEQKTIYMKFTDPDGGGEINLIWELEEK